MLGRHGHEIAAVARGRHVTGHYLLGDEGLHDLTEGELRREVITELADSFIFSNRLLQLIS